MAGTAVAEVLSAIQMPTAMRSTPARSPRRQRSRPYPPPELTPWLAASKTMVRPVVTTLLPRELIAAGCLLTVTFTLSVCHSVTLTKKKKEHANVMTD
jgi:hypothetical protein